MNQIEAGDRAGLTDIAESSRFPAQFAKSLLLMNSFEDV
jgi:hypothetical protein